MRLKASVTILLSLLMSLEVKVDRWEKINNEMMLVMIMMVEDCYDHVCWGLGTV